MNRPCNVALRCDDPDDALTRFSSIVAPSAAGLCRGVNCPGSDGFANLSTECSDVDFLADGFACFCQGDALDIFFRAPGIGPFTWTVGALPFGIFAIHPPACPGLLQLTGTFLTGGRFFVDVQVTDGFGNVTKATEHWNVLAILTPTIPTPSIGVPYSFTLQASGGSGHYAWKIVGGALAPGLNLTASGLITGTPTGSQPAMVQFKVIDTECEQPDITFLQPYAVLVGATTTITATILGFPEFQSSGLPPKAYKTVDWTGGADNHVFNTIIPSLSYFIAAAYCDQTQIDSAGAIISCRHEQSVRQGSGGGMVTLTGPCLFGNFIANQILLDTFCPTSNAFVNGPNAAVRDAVMGLFGEAGYTNFIGTTTAQAIRNAVSGTTVYNIDRTVTLSNEYTDAEAVANAQVTNGMGLVAASFPRTTGWISQWTNCNFNLILNNLQVGQNYVATVTLLHSGGLIQLKTYNVTATSDTMTIPDSIPVPADGEWIAAGLPTVAFAP